MESFTKTSSASLPPSPEAKPVFLQLKGVGYRYGDHQVLRDLNLDLDLRSRIAIIGSVGAGKTTLLRMLCGEIPPTEGTIVVRFDDESSGDLWDPNIYQALRRSIAYVPQEPFISNATLATNIALDEQTGVTKDVVQAAYLAELEADIASFKSGFAEMVGETGVNLSGGQKQRINIARAFFADRPILLLDDPLSAVDARTEVSLMEALIHKSLGFVLVTHRLTELKRVDRIITLDDGQIAEDDAASTLFTREDSRFMRLLLASHSPSEGAVTV